MQPEFDSFGFERLLQLARDVLVFSRQDLRAAMHDRHTAPETPKHLAEFQANVPGTENKQMFRHLADFHERFVCQIIDRIQARKLWRMGTRACIDKDPLTLQDLIIDLYLVRGQKMRVTTIEAQAGM